MGSRHRAREYAVQILFQLDVTGDAPDTMLGQFWADRRAPDDVRAFAEEIVHSAWAHVTQIDALLEESASHWKVPRMAIVDRNVLRLALAELVYLRSTPPAVVLDEAIELAKRFGNADSGPFVNGVLDAIRRRLEEGSLTPAPAPAVDAARPGTS